MNLVNPDAPFEDFLYERGLLFSPSFYKEAVKKDKVTTEKDLQIAKGCEIILEVAKRVTTIALIIIPCAGIMGTGSTLTLFSLGVFSGVFSASAESDFIRPFTPYEQIEAKAKLFVQLDLKDKARYLAQDYLITTALKVSGAVFLYTVREVRFIGYLSRLIAVTSVGSQYGEEILAGILKGVEWYFETYKKPHLLEMLERT